MDESYLEKLGEWYHWFQLSQIVIPCSFCTRPELPVSSTLMVFCDASESVYGTCAYLVLGCGDNMIADSLVAAKVSVALLYPGCRRR